MLFKFSLLPRILPHALSKLSLPGLSFLESRYHIVLSRCIIFRSESAETYLEVEDDAASMTTFKPLRIHGNSASSLISPNTQLAFILLCILLLSYWDLRRKKVLLTAKQMWFNLLHSILEPVWHRNKYSICMYSVYYLDVYQNNLKNQGLVLMV